MTTKISTLIDSMRSIVDAALPDHLEVLNPYFPEESDDLTLKQCWGLAVRGGLNSHREQNCRYSMVQNIELVIARTAFNGHIRTATSIQERVEVEKLLMEDRHLVVSSFENNPQINSSDIARCEFLNDGGIEFVRIDETNLLMIKMNFEVEYFESLNS